MNKVDGQRYLAGYIKDTTRNMERVGYKRQMRGSEMPTFSNFVCFGVPSLSFGYLPISVVWLP